VTPEISNTYILATFFILLVPSLLGVMAWEARTIDITTLHIDGAPEDIVFIADPHVKESNIEHVRSVIEEINALHPSVVLIGGDFANGAEADFALHSVWSEIDAPVYAVLGNHDYRTGTDGIGGLKKMISVSGAEFTKDSYNAGSLYDEHTDTAFADALAEELERNNVQVLKNEVVDLPLGERTLRIVGVDDGWAGMAAPPAVSKTDAFTIYMIHEPSCRGDWDADLILAGHTHGGQFMVPLLGLFNDQGIVELSGMHRKGGAPTYITRGICGSTLAGVELRFNARPEIVIINPSHEIPGQVMMEMTTISS
jgi:uncharacterized protein